MLLSRPRQRIGLHIGEALHRLDHAFLVAEPGILDAAERRHLDAIARHFPDIDGADFQLVDEARDVVEPVGADARREPVGGRIRNADHLRDVVRAADDRDDRAERLLAHQFAVVRHVVDDGRRIERALPVVAVQQLRALLPPHRSTRRSNSFAAPSWITVPTSVAGSIGSPAFSFFALASTQLGKFVRDLLDHEDALHRRAALAGVLGRAGDRKLGRLVEVGVLHDDQRIVAAELQHDAPIAGLVGDVLADLHRAGERDQVAVRVGDHGIAHGRTDCR